MADTATRTSTSARPAPGAAPRQVRRRRTLPSSRAVVGGFLVAAAAVGTFGAHSASGAGPTATYLAVARDVDAGERLAAADLTPVQVDLPDVQARTMLADLSVAAGAVAVAPLEAGQLLAASDVVKLDGVVGRAQLSIPVEPARANNGQLRRGELVDVLATTTSAGASSTETIARDAVVVRAYSGDEALGASSSVVVTLSVTAGELEPVAGAAAGATISIARVSGLGRVVAGTVVVDGRPAGGDEAAG